MVHMTDAEVNLKEKFIDVLPTANPKIPKRGRIFCDALRARHALL